MDSIDLNIVQRGLTENLGWSANMGQITPDDLGKVSESRTDNSGSLNALPTPFARFFVFKEAFRRVLEQKQNPGNPSKEAGRAYEQLVSNTLDVFELLYNMKWHENQWRNIGRKISIREWNYADNLPVLKENVPILGNAVESYFRDDMGDSSRRLFFVLLEDAGKDYLLGTSSPMTGFITPPDLDLVPDGKGQNQYMFVGEFYRSLLANPIKRRCGGNYFQDVVLFEKRHPDFRNYLYNKLFADGASLDGSYSTLRNYVQAFEADRDIVKNWSDSELKPIYSEDNNELEVNGLKIYCSDGKDAVNYFQNVLVKMPYPINKEKFMTAVSSSRNGDSSSCYMLPLTREGLLELKSGDFKFEYKESSVGDVDFTLKTAGTTYSQRYLKTAEDSRPRVLDMSGCRKNFGLSVFPNVLSSDKNENNYFKVMVSAYDGNGNKTFSVQNAALEFFRKGDDGKFEPIAEVGKNDGFEFGVKSPVVRSEQKDDVKSGTKYYEVFNSSFDAVLVNLDDDGVMVSFVVFPQWDEAKGSAKAYTYAVDLGTSNTYISRREKGTYVEPQQLEMANVISSSIYSYGYTAQRSLVNRIEDSYPDEFRSQILTEFVPPLIDGKVYKFPIRTALCVKKNTNKPVLFDNSNIAFFYEKRECPSNHTIKANVKWSDEEENLRVFVREILLLIKADILQENGVIDDTEIIWFRPLSFKVSIKNRFPRLWEEEASKILKLKDPSSQIKCYTESEAPYYYFDTKGRVANRDSVAVIDIGGGTADAVYYRNGKPAIANSVRFGCDVLWGEGFSKMTNSKENGIYAYYKEKVDISDDTLKSVYKSMAETSSDASSSDIINFWLNNRHAVKVVDRFGTDFKPVFAYHYVSLIYYMMSLFRVNKLEYPKTIIFSGNGSRYIDDFLSDTKTLEEITSKVISKVYETDVTEKVELVLPEFRKECTCYGGLYHADSAEEPASVVYVGDCSGREFENVAQLKKAYSAGLKMEVEGEVHKMNGIFDDVMKMLVQKGVSEPFKLEEIKRTVDDVVDNALESNFQKTVVEGCSDDEAFNDSLFFYSVIQGIFELTKACPKAKK